MLFIPDERVHNSVGQVNPSSDILVRPIIVIHYATQVCETFGDLHILITEMDRLICVMKKVSKWLNLGFDPGNLSS